MALPTIENFNLEFNHFFESDLKTRRKLKAIAKYNKLSIKTKIKKLKDNLEYNMRYLQAKFDAEVKIVEQGGHPEDELLLYPDERILSSKKKKKS